MKASEKNLKLKSGKWIVDISFTKPNGKLKRVRAAFPTKTEAKAHLDLVRGQKASRRLGIEVPEVKSRDLLFKDFAESAISRPRKRKIRAETKKGLRICLNGIMRSPLFEGKKLSEITADDVAQYHADLGIDRPASANAGLGFLKMVFGRAVACGELERNPTALVERSEAPEGRLRILTDDEAELLLNACEPRLVPLVRLLLVTGMRPHEAFALRWEYDGWDVEEDLDKSIVALGRKVIFIPGLLAKNHKDRQVPLSPELLEMFRELHKDSKSDKVFPWRESPPCFREAVKATKLKNVVLYSLKHTAASRMIRAGVDIVTVSEILGHSDIKMTMRYCHSEGASKRDAIERVSRIYFKTAPVADRPLVGGRAGLPSPDPAGFARTAKGGGKAGEASPLEGKVN